MDNLRYVVQLLGEVWRLFSLEWPGLGLSFAQVMIGTFLLHKGIDLVEGFLGLNEKGDGKNS